MKKVFTHLVAHVLHFGRAAGRRSRLDEAGFCRAGEEQEKKKFNKTRSQTFP